MLENGFIKLHRSLLTWEWYTDNNTKIVFLHLLLTANYYDEKWRGHIIKRGSRAVGRKQLAKELQISEQSVRTAIKHLISTNEITTQTVSKIRIITINNYEKYQNLTNNLTADQPETNQKLTRYQPQIKKAKKAKNEKENILGSAPSPLIVNPEDLTQEELEAKLAALRK